MVSSSQEPLPEIDLPAELARREALTASKWKALRQALAIFLPEGDERWRRVCVYVTGSMARDEACEYSDLDLFVMHEVGDSASTGLTAVEYSQLISALDQVRKTADFRAFSRGGQFLVPHSFREMVAHVGHPDDDAQNWFTARMLLLINSTSFLSNSVYESAWETVLDHYWRRAKSPDDLFFPIYLTNDIRRWWSGLCLNFEHDNPPSHTEDTVRAKRRVANLKLRYARLFAVYTPLVGLLSAATDTGISRDEARVVLRRTPIARLRHLSESRSDEDIRDQIHSLLARYSSYLEFMDATEEELLSRVLGSDWRDVKHESYKFGDEVHALLRSIGEGKALYRYIMV